jgi:Rrf2 family protein
MLKLNRITEYGLMALAYIKAKEEGSLSSAREIADNLNLPFEILAKTLQKLKEQEIISASYGTRGGYSLNKDLSSISLYEYLLSMEGNNGVVPCVSLSDNHNSTTTNLKDNCCCSYEANCSIKPNMSILNEKLTSFLKTIKLSEITSELITNSLTNQ